MFKKLYAPGVPMVSMKRCPVCHSDELELYMGAQFGKYRCKSCGYLGPLVLEQDFPELEQVEQATRKKKEKSKRKPKKEKPKKEKHGTRT